VNKTTRVHAGQFNRIGEFFDYPDVPDGYGGTVPGPRALLLRTKVGVTPLSGQPTFHALEIGMTNPYEVVMRTRAGFEPTVKQEIEIDGNKYSIKKIVDVNYRQRVAILWADRFSDSV